MVSFFSCLEQPFLWLGDRIYNDFIFEGRYMYMVSGLGVTLLIAFFATLLGIALGLITALVKVIALHSKKVKPFEWIADLYITVIRGTPMMVQLMIVYFVIFASVNISKTLVAIMAFGINSGAYVAEIIRAGILSVDRGQSEAGRSLGLSSGQTYRYIILPQAIKNILPALGNEFITLLKDTSIGIYIGLQDLTMSSNIIKSITFDPFVPLIATALIYLAIVLFMSFLLKKMERRLRQSDIH